MDTHENRMFGVLTSVYQSFVSTDRHLDVQRIHVAAWTIGISYGTTLRGVNLPGGPNFCDKLPQNWVASDRLSASPTPKISH